MKSLFGAAVFGLVCLLLPLGAAAQAGSEDGGYGAADAGSLGVSPVDVDGWCAADAGSLGHPDPVAACGR